MVTSFLIVDGNNWFRRRAETDVFGNPLRRCYNELQTAPYDVVIMVWDGYNALASRRAIYPEYKSKRKFAGESLYEFQKTFKEVVLHSRAISIQVDGFEGDDVIAALVKEYGSKPEISIFIESNDADLAQLGCPMARDKFKVEPKWVALYKTLVGDSSDNIPGIPGFGDKAWENLSEKDKIEFQNMVSGGNYFLEPDNLTKRTQNWLTPENIDLLRKYWKIVNFIPVDKDKLYLAMKPGTNNYGEAEKILGKFFA